MAHKCLTSVFTATYLAIGTDDGCCHGYNSVVMATLTTTLCAGSLQILVTLAGIQVVCFFTFSFLVEAMSRQVQ